MGTGGGPASGPGWHVVVTGPRAGDQRREALDFLAVSLGLRPATFEVTHRCPHCGSEDHGQPELRHSRVARRRRGPDALAAGDLAAPLPAVSFSRAGGWLATAWLGAPDAAAGWRIGVDLEQAGSAAFAGPSELAGVGFSATEERLIGALEDHVRPGARGQLWCAKEALAKARGTGFIGDPADVAVTAPGSLELAVPDRPGARIVPDRDWPGGHAPDHLLGAVVLLPPAGHRPPAGPGAEGAPAASA
ncbi:4'-phosphopantetheinyl transferase superfamily protein [Citricoccus sp.]|uniref:4'-phosphopantetheinyl transferase family protein n=1 Tax=Citricoccus sp. TaxID=1978372 RepID=UPI0028BED324|nr:4'-phosphopantetheinyl transferase superfamily protein [Citricoccus sp.]